MQIVMGVSPFVYITALPWELHWWCLFKLLVVIIKQLMTEVSSGMSTPITAWPMTAEATLGWNSILPHLRDENSSNHEPLPEGLGNWNIAVLFSLVVKCLRTPRYSHSSQYFFTLRYCFYFYFIIFTSFMNIGYVYQSDNGGKSTVNARQTEFLLLES